MCSIKIVCANKVRELKLKYCEKATKIERYLPLFCLSLFSNNRSTWYFLRSGTGSLLLKKEKRQPDLFSFWITITIFFATHFWTFFSGSQTMCSKKIDWASGRFLQMFVAFSEYPNTYRAARVPLQRTITLACSNRKFIKISYTVSGVLGLLCSMHHLFMVDCVWSNRVFSSSISSHSSFM